jgi:hypothetical protein
MAGPVRWRNEVVGVMKLDVADVERDGRLVQIDGVVRVASEDPSASGNAQSAEAAIPAAVVADEGAAQNFGDVVHSALQAHCVEIEHLLGIMRCDRGRKAHL